MKIEQSRYARSKSVSYWTTTALTAFILVSGGLWLMLGNQPMEAHLGYPKYFWQILGFCKILGGVAILVPRFPLLKEWAYAGIVFNLTGANDNAHSRLPGVQRIETGFGLPERFKTR